MSAKIQQRKFVSVDPGKCIGCGICEYACTVEKGEGIWNPIRSRIRVVRMAPVFNFALTCRGCQDARCVKACPERALITIRKHRLTNHRRNQMQRLRLVRSSLRTRRNHHPRRHRKSHRMQPLRRRTKMRRIMPRRSLRNC